MLIAFGGVVFLQALIVFVIVVAWALLSYTRGTAKAAEEGIDPGPDEHPDAGHVAGPVGDATMRGT